VAQIIPFRGYRYDPKKVGRLTDVVSPPYDRVDPDVQESCYRRSQHNIVRIIKGKEKPGDGPSQNVYTRAAGFLREWIARGTLVRDAEPNIYVYHQAYPFGGERLVRKGIIALGKLEPEKVHAHERTLTGPKEDRLRLMRATEANFGHIFMLYADSQRAADSVVGRAIAGRGPDAVAEDGDGNEHRVWAVSDHATIDAVQRAMADKDLYIADGHHRYETAVNYMGECEANGWRPAAPESFDVRMMTLFNIDEPGMSIRPIHRLVHGLDDFDAEAFLTAAEEAFIVERHPSFERMADATAASAGSHTFGCVTRGAFAALRLREELDLHGLVSRERSDDYVRLDVAVLHATIFERLLEIDARALEEQRNVTYTVDPSKAIRGVESGAEQLFFYLNPTSAEEVVRVADQGEKMPQKSTDFYPKLLTGLVLSKMEIDKTS